MDAQYLMYQVHFIDAMGNLFGADILLAENDTLQVSMHLPMRMSDMLQRRLKFQKTKPKSCLRH